MIDQAIDTDMLADDQNTAVRFPDDQNKKLSIQIFIASVFLKTTDNNTGGQSSNNTALPTVSEPITCCNIAIQYH